MLRLVVQNRFSEFELYYEYETFINDLLRKDLKQIKLDNFLSKYSRALHCICGKLLFQLYEISFLSWFTCNFFFMIH